MKKRVWALLLAVMMVVSVLPTGVFAWGYGGTIYMVAGNKKQLTGDSAGVSWSSSNTNVATVSSNGLVEAKAAGTATITQDCVGGWYFSYNPWNWGWQQRTWTNTWTIVVEAAGSGGNDDNFSWNGKTRSIKWNQMETSSGAQGKAEEMDSEYLGKVTVTCDTTSMTKKTTIVDWNTAVANGFTITADPGYKITGVSLRCDDHSGASCNTYSKHQVTMTEDYDTTTVTLTGDMVKTLWKRHLTANGGTNNTGAGSYIWLCVSITRDTTHKVTYEYQNAPEGAAGLPDGADYYAGTAVTVAAQPAAVSGYTFDGWYLNGEKVTTFTMPNNDVTLVGYWDEDNWKDGNPDSETGGDGTPDRQQALVKYVSADTTMGTVTGNVEVFTLTATNGLYSGNITAQGDTAVANSGYEFEKWTLSINGGDEADQTLLAATEEILFTAYGNYTYVYKAYFKATTPPPTPTYTVTYTDGVDGEEVFEDQVYSDLTSGAATPAFDGTPTREGYNFLGWNPTVADTVTATVTYIATWQKHATVDLNGENGNGLIFKTLTSESGAYKKDGHTFTVTVTPQQPDSVNANFNAYSGDAVEGAVIVDNVTKTAFKFNEKLTFSAAGTYKFTVAEEVVTGTNIDYDDATYTMQVKVEESDNKLEVTEIKFFENSKDSIEITPITPITLSLEVPSDGFVKPEPTPTPTPNPALYSGYTVTFKNTLKKDGQEPSKDPIIGPTIKAELSVTKTVDGVYYRDTDTNLVKREDGAAAQAGDTVRWTITVKNSGRAPGTYTLNDQFDGVVTNDDEIKIYDAEGNQVTGQQTIGKGATILYTAEYVVKATDIGKTLVNKVTLVSGKEGVTDPSDTADGVETAGLSVKKEIKEIYDPTDSNRDGHDDPVVGDRIAYTITVKNIGSADLTGIKVQDTMIGAGTLSVSAEDKAVWGNGFDLKAGESRTFEVEYQTVMADRDTEVYNTVVVGTEVNNDGNLKPMAEAESEKVKVKVVPTPATFDPNNPTDAEKGEEQPLLWKSFTYKDNSANFPDGHMATFEALITPVTGEGLTEYNGKPVKGYVRYIESNNADWHDLGKTMEFQYYADVDKDYTDVLTFTEPGTYVFDVFENIPNVEYRIDGVTYDETHYTLTVTVEPDENNDLVVSDWTLVRVVEEGKEPYSVEFATFNNTYYKEKEKEDKPNTVTPVGPSVTPKLNREDHYAYIVGMPDGLVHPEQNITRAEVATIFFRMLLDESRDYWWCQTNSFSDVAEDAWYNNAISTLTNAGLLNGYPDGRFGPNDNITRAEFAAIAVRFFTDEAEDVKITGDAFPDIAKSWANYEINLAYALDLVQGTGEGTFEPDRQITRAEAMTIVNRVLKRAPEKDHLLDDMIEWPDNMNTRAWYYAAVQEATNSHEYYKTKDKSGDEYEVWTELKEVRDWVALEKEWSNAHSSDNPGEVVSKGTETPEPGKGGKLTVD